ncbi:MAG TPA: hypothetical protein VD995_18400 [Azospirillum sp.]|nr:hypothetical protein [Azospirillum sp.]
MKAPLISNDVFAATQVHLSVLDEFIAVVQKKLDETPNPFARDSLKDLLGSLTDQRDSYVAYADPVAAAA